MSEIDPELPRGGRPAGSGRETRLLRQAVAGQVLPAEAHQAALSSLFHDFGERWQIQHQLSPQCWTAVRRPEPSQVILKVAHDLEGLRAKMTAAETELPEPE